MSKHKVKKVDKTTIIIVSAIVLFIGLGIVGIFSSLLKQSQQTTSNQPNGEIALTLENQPFIGDENAPITLVEFADFKCPYCKQWEEEVYQKLKPEYIDTGKIKLYFKNLAFIGPDSITAAIAGEAIYNQNPAAFWEYYELMFKYQGDERKQWATHDFIMDLVKEHIDGIDYEQLSSDIKKKTTSDEVNNDFLEAQRNGITGTPTLIVDGQFAYNPFDYEALKAYIDARLSQELMPQLEEEGTSEQTEQVTEGASDAKE